MADVLRKQKHLGPPTAAERTMLFVARVLAVLLLAAAVAAGLSGCTHTGGQPGIKWRQL